MKPLLHSSAGLMTVAISLLLAPHAARGQALALNDATTGQSFQQIAPKEAPKKAPGKVVDEGLTPPISGHSDTEVLVKKLKGVTIVGSPKEVRAGGFTGKPGVDPGTVKLAQGSEFAATVQPYVGQPVTMNSLSELTRSIVGYYRDHDRPVVNVYVPQQSITSGYVQVVVIESKVEKVDSTGAKHFSNQNLREEIRLRPGDPISSNAMRDDINWINRNPFLQSDLLMAPGDAPGTTDVLLRTQDRFPLRLYVGYEDSGNQFTGDDRILTGFNYGNLFGLGQQLSYQFTAGENVNKFYAHSGTYIVPLPWKHQLTFFGSYAATDAQVGNNTETAGVNWQVSGRYEIPLPSTAHFTESISGGFDFKRSNNNNLFNVVNFQTNTNTDVDQLVLGYQASGDDAYGSTSGSITGFFSPGGGVTSYNDDSDYVTQRPGATSDYIYGQLAANRVTRLPWDFSWTVRGVLQFSDANLLPSEQLGLGGYSTVRGYDEREANGDDGFLISTEVATPPVSLFHLFGCNKVNDQLQFLGFVDYGGVSLHHVEASDVNPSSNLLGVGPGLRYIINPYVSLRFDYGFQLIDTGLDNRHNSRAHLGVVVSY